MQDNITFASEARRTGTRTVVLGLSAIVLILLVAGALLLFTLPDANAFNDRVAQIFAENDNLQTQSEVRLLEILAQSGTTFSETLASYRIVIVVLLVFATAMLVAALVFLVHAGRRSTAAWPRSSGRGIRGEFPADQPRGEDRLPERPRLQADRMRRWRRWPYLAEARMDDDVLTGVRDRSA